MLLTMYIGGGVAVVAILLAHLLWEKKTSIAAFFVAISVVASAVALLFSFLSVAAWAWIIACAVVAVYSIILVIGLMFARESSDYYETHLPVTRDIDRPLRDLSHERRDRSHDRQDRAHSQRDRSNEQQQPVRVHDLVDRKKS